MRLSIPTSLLLKRLKMPENIKSTAGHHIKYKEYGQTLTEETIAGADYSLRGPCTAPNVSADLMEYERVKDVYILKGMNKMLDIYLGLICVSCAPARVNEIAYDVD